MSTLVHDPKEIFLNAVEKSTPAERAAYLDEACAGNAPLRQRVEELLAAHAEPNSLLDRPGLAATIQIPASEHLGTTIGPYKLLQQIGEGGMGVVYMAEQTTPVERRVALKIIKPGMDTRQIIARFEAERQALALMDHPNIAKVLDAGTTDSGRPYFVMELVKGVPITRFCDERHLTVQQRLELFIPVCQAIQHAHQKGIIHRDIKPSNVLVAEYDERAVAKIIDFGVAKAIGPRLTVKTMFTELGQLVGTLEYMSPEQAKLNQLDIDTRSDIYSLGVLLYELLTGSTPFDKGSLKSAAFDEVLRIIREQEPQRPSTKLSSSDALPSIAANRHTEPARLSRQVRGELDWIVMKALDKDRSRRYETANGLALDVQRYLDDEPVLACPPSSAYRFQKFARRNKGGVAMAGASVLAVLLALLGLTVSNVLITHEKNLKVAALQQAKTNEQAAQTQKGIAEANEAKAKVQERIALANERTAQANELLARRRYYAAQMNLAMQAWRGGNRPRVLELLEGQRPKPGETDLRGFEWHYLWRLCYGEDRVPIAGHRTAVLSVAFSKDGKTLVSGGVDGTTRLWDVFTGEELETLRAPGTEIWWVAYSPDGRWLATSDRYQRLTIWDANTREQRHAIAGAIGGIAFSPDGKYVAGGIADASSVHATLWDLDNGKQHTQLNNAGFPIGFLPDGSTLVTMSDQHLPTGKVSWWNLQTKQELRSKAVPGMNTAAVSPDGTRVAAALWKSQWNVLVWDAITGDSLAELPQPSVVRSLAFAPDSKLLAIGKEDKMATIWNLETKTPLAHEVHLDHVWAAAFSPDGSRLASATLGGAIKVWDLKFAEEATTIPIPKVSALQFAPDGKTLLVGTPQATKVIDVASGREIAEIPVGGIKAIAAKDRVGARLASSDQALIFDLQSGRQIASLSLPGTGSPGLAWSPDGERLATFRSWKDYKKVHVWDLATQQTRTFQPEMGCHSAMSAAFSPDGKWLAAGFQFQLLTVWDTASGKIKLQFDLWPFMMNIVAISFSPDSRWVAVGTDVGAVTIWEIGTGKQLADCKGHALPVRSLSFSPDGGTLATASDDQTVKLWDTITGQERSTLSGHQGAVSRVQFSSDGNTIATTSNDGTVKLWRAAAHAAVQDPKNLDLGTGQAFAQAQMRQWEQAAKSCEWAMAKAQQASAERRPALLKRCLEDCDAIAKQMFAAGEHAIAMGMYERNIALAEVLGAETTPEGRLSQSLRYNDLAFCYFPQQQLLKAETAVSRAIELKAGLAKEFPTDGNYSFHLAHSHLGLAYILHAAGNASGAVENFRTAGVEFEKSARLKGNWQTWKDSGRAYATSGEWAKAAAAFHEAVRLRPGDHALWIDLATLSAMAGDRTNYERVCREMLERHPELHQPFGPSEKPMIAERIAKACAILPWEGKEFSQVETLADLAVADSANPTFRWSALAKALVEYRGKRFQSAVDWVNRFVPSPDGSHADALAYAVLALAQHRLGDMERASEALQRAESIVTAKKPTLGRHLFDANDQNWLLADLLLREARAEVNKVNP